MGTSSVNVQSSLSETSISIEKNYKAPGFLTAHHLQTWLYFLRGNKESLQRR